MVLYYSEQKIDKTVVIVEGYGKKALSELENKMKEEGYKRFQLLAEETNPKAIKFYDREHYSKQKINFFCKYL